MKNIALAILSVGVYACNMWYFKLKGRDADLGNIVAFAAAIATFIV